MNLYNRQLIRIDHIDDYIPDTLISHELDKSGRYLKVQLTDDGVIRDTADITLHLAWRHANGNTGLEPFTAVDTTQGIYEVSYPSAMLSDGMVTASIQVAQGNEIAHTRNFHIRVQDSPIDGETTASAETWTSLQLIIGQGQTAINTLKTQTSQQASDWQVQTNQQQSDFDAAQTQRAEEFTAAQTQRDTNFQAQLTAQQSQVDEYLARPIDADTLDGKDRADFALANHNHDDTYAPENLIQVGGTEPSATSGVKIWIEGGGVVRVLIDGAWERLYGEPKVFSVESSMAQNFDCNNLPYSRMLIHSNVPNSPGGAVFWYIHTYKYNTGGFAQKQIAYAYTNNSIKQRFKHDTWKPWETIV